MVYEWMSATRTGDTFARLRLGSIGSAIVTTSDTGRRLLRLRLGLGLGLRIMLTLIIIRYLQGPSHV